MADLSAGLVADDTLMLDHRGFDILAQINTIWYDLAFRLFQVLRIFKGDM
jgi:hypothetical protein